MIMSQHSSIRAAAAVALSLAASGCGLALETLPARAAQDTKSTTTSVTVVRPERLTLRKITRQPGQIEAYEGTSLHAKIAGYIRSIAVDIGDRVQAGQVIAELDDPELLAEHKQKLALVKQAQAQRDQARSTVDVAASSIVSAEAKVSEAGASIRRTEADVARWRAEYDRTSQLVRERAITGALLDETRNKLEASRAANDEATAKVRTAEAALSQARSQLAQAEADLVAAEARIEVATADASRVQALVDYTRIVAPFDGVITKRHVHVGHLTVPGGHSDPLFTIERTDRVRVVVAVPELDAPLIDPEDKAEIILQALKGDPIVGQVARTAWSLDQSTRTLRAEIDLENPDGRLRPGLYAYATVIADERPNALTLPTTSIIRDPAGKVSCMIVENGNAVRRPIETGLDDGKHVEILSGLQPDDNVVSTNPASLQEGQSVQLSQPQPKSP
jgi:RND family efflux transporter MFP subunit